MKRYTLLAFLLCLVALSSVSRSVLAQGVAMVLDRTGTVEAIHAGKARRLNVLDYLAADSEVRLADAASATLVYLASSREWQFTGPGRYRLKSDAPAVLQGAAPKARGVPAPSAQAMVKLEPAQRERLALGAMVMRGDGPLRIVSPNGVDVLTNQPTLIWLAGDGQEIRVSVFDESQQIVAQGVATKMPWPLPKALPPGEYTWRIEATAAGGSPRLGRFRIIGDDDERRALPTRPPAEFAQRVAHAVMLESHDLPHDALMLWRALAAERPDEESLQQWAR
ncbi:MAG: hypothetical protein IPG66_04290 [Hydrogenophilales bacterium]|nr:hypothetical protein [Hydrogenophilales bacterium]